jgi:hypothetical protein
MMGRTNQILNVIAETKNRRTKMNLMRGKKQSLVASLLFATLAASPAHADLLVQYDLDSVATPLAPSTVNPGLGSASSISFGGFAGAWTESGGTLHYGPGAANTAALAVASGDIATFTITSPSLMNLTSLTLDGAYGQFANAAGYAVESSVDGFSSILSTADFATQAPTFTTETIDLSGASFQGLSTITFEIFGYAHNSGQIQYDNITVNGALTAVPEPNALALMGTGLMSLFGLMAWRRRN